MTRIPYLAIALMAIVMALSSPAAADAYTVKDLDQRVTAFKTLNASAQNLTAAWADIGPEIDVKSFSAVTMLVILDVNDSTGVQIRPLGLTAKGATDEYFLPIKSQSAAAVGVQPLVYGLTNDSDQKLMIQIPVNAYNILQLQIKAAVAGGSPGTILIKYNASYL